MQLRSFAKKSTAPRHGYPFSTEIVKNFQELDFPAPVVFFVGENGSGKSTLLEGLAAAIELPTIGSDSTAKDRSLAPARELADELELTWTKNNHRGFFLRAEDFFGYQKKLALEQAELRAQAQEFSNKFGDYGSMLASGSAKAQARELEEKYGDNPDAFSHGESFLNLFLNRVVPEGLYLLDEPEAPLSPVRILSLISVIKKAVEDGSQFIIATHSPILLAFSGAVIYEFREGKARKAKYDELEHVSITREFLENPEAFMKHL